MTAPDLTQPHGAPDQKARVLEWLQSEPQGLTQLDALQHLAVARLAAIVYRLKHDDGHNIVTELVEMPTRYGLAKVARYHLLPRGQVGYFSNGALIGFGPAPELGRPEQAYASGGLISGSGPVPSILEPAGTEYLPRETAERLEAATRTPRYRCSVCCDRGQVMGSGDASHRAAPCPAVGCEARDRGNQADFDRLTAPSTVTVRDFDQAVRGPLDFEQLRRDAGLS